jgi:hypothetical protein
MALYSFIVEHEGETFTTQFAGESVEEATRSFFAHPMAAAASPALKPDHIIYIHPMKDLINTWAVCAGEEGRYACITAVRVEEEPGV